MSGNFWFQIFLRTYSFSTEPIVYLEIKGFLCESELEQKLIWYFFRIYCKLKKNLPLKKWSKLFNYCFWKLKKLKNYFDEGNIVKRIIFTITKKLERIFLIVWSQLLNCKAINNKEPHEKNLLTPESPWCLKLV